MIMMMSKCNYREYRTKDVKQQRVNFIGSELFEIFRCLNAFHTHKKERNMQRKDLLQFFDILIKKIWDSTPLIIFQVEKTWWFFHLQDFLSRAREFLSPMGCTSEKNSEMTQNNMPHIHSIIHNSLINYLFRPNVNKSMHTLQTDTH